MTDLYYPLRSLREGHWFKLICGASFQHLPAVRNLVLAYTLAGVDCIDVAADPAVILTAKTALRTAAAIAATDRRKLATSAHMPWLMVSFNDGEDPHFRKAEFDATACPTDCPRPCETICPAQAITFRTTQPTTERDGAGNLLRHSTTNPALEPIAGVSSDRCYGCGRCLPVCPIQHIAARAYVSTPAAIAPLVLQTGVDAIEIHTQVGRLADFRRLWQAIAPWVNHLKLVAISCPDGDGLIAYLRSLYDIIAPLPCPLIWQTDGRPMSGDIGMGATRAAVKLSQKVLAAKLPGYVQLAGGTNHHTVPKLRSLGLLHPPVHRRSTPLPSTDLCQHNDPSDWQSAVYVAGVAYGSYARTLLTPILSQLEAIAMSAIDRNQATIAPIPDQAPFNSTLYPSAMQQQSASTPSQPPQLEEVPDLLWQAVTLARSLVSQLKPANDALLAHAET